MKKYLHIIHPAVFMLAVLVSTNLKAQIVIQIPYGAQPAIDGKISIAEWDDANTLILTASPQTKILYKHDSSNFYIAFVGNLQSGNKFPEILLDINNSGSAEWQNDDWWFHVSATDCEYKGEYGNYDNCELVRNNWKAERNFENGSIKTDTVEMQIPFSTINLDMNVNDSIGISFLTTNTFSSWQHWPSNANRNAPSTWGTAVFSGKAATSIFQNEPKPGVNIYPNPACGSFTIDAQNLKAGSIVSIYNTSGRLILTENIQTFKVAHTANFTLPPAVYILRLVSGNECLTRKIIVN